MNKLTETEKAYIAGLLDGEGSVGIAKFKSQSNAYEYDFTIRIIITNSYFPIVCWLKEKTGIGCAYEYHKGFKENWNAVHRWQVTSIQAREFILTIYPYVQIKKSIIDLILLLPHGRQKGMRYGTRTINEYKRQEEIFNAAKIKNKRGK